VLVTVDRLSGNTRAAQIFVAVTGASNSTYVEASWAQTLYDWIGAHTCLSCRCRTTPKSQSSKHAATSRNSARSRAPGRSINDAWFRYVTLRVRPHVPTPLGERPITNAERQARYRTAVAAASR
jgi:hypothetical protein